MKTVVTLIGLPGAGKTVLGDMIHALIGGARINADVVRKTISQDLTFTELDREIQAYRMGQLAGLSLHEPMTLICGHNGVPIGHLNRYAVVDFICPTQNTRSVYEWALRSSMTTPVRRFTIWMNTITRDESKYKDTAALFEDPKAVDLVVSGYKDKKQLAYIASTVATDIKPDLRDSKEFLDKVYQLGV